MGDLVTIEFASKALRVERSLADKARKCLDEFLKYGSFKSAEKLRLIAIPASEFAGALCLPDGSWIAEIRYDNLLHEGEGETEAAALVDAILRIAEATKTSSSGNDSDPIEPVRCFIRPG